MTYINTTTLYLWKPSVNLVLFLFLITINTSAQVKPTQSAFHYFKDYPRVLYFVETSHLERDLPQGLVLSSFQQMLWSVSDRFNVIEGAPFSKNWNYDLLHHTGLELTRVNHRPLITRVIPGSPADKAGLKEHMMILEIAHQSTYFMNTYDIAFRMLQGKETEMQVEDSRSVRPDIQLLTFNPTDWPFMMPEMECEFDLSEELVIINSISSSDDLNSAIRLSDSLLIDMRSIFLSSDGDLVEWLFAMIPNTETVLKQSKGGEHHVLGNRSNMADSRSGLEVHEIFLLVDSHIWGLNEVFCSMAKANGVIILGEQTSGFPFGKKWLPVHGGLSMEIAYWSYRIMPQSVTVDVAVTPDILLPAGEELSLKWAVKAIAEFASKRREAY